MLQRLMNAFHSVRTTAIIASGTAVATIAPTSMAQTDYDTITGAVDWADVTTAVLAVGAAIVGVLVVIKGIKITLRMVRGA